MFCLSLTWTLSYHQVWANPQAVAYEPLSTVQGPNVQSFNNGEDYTSRRKNEFASCLYPTKQDFSMRKAVLVMGRDNVHGRDVQDCPVHGHELCNVQDMSRTFYI